MYVVRDFMFAVAMVIDYALWAYMWLIIIRAFLSWVDPDPSNPIVQFIHRATEPVLRPIRRRLPQTAIDLSPLIVIFAIMFLQLFLVPVLKDTAIRL